MRERGVSDSRVHRGASFCRSTSAASGVGAKTRSRIKFGPGVYRVVQDGLAQVGHAHLVQIREGQGQAHRRLSGSLVHGAVLVAEVMARLWKQGQVLTHARLRRASRLGIVNPWTQSPDK